MLLLWLAASLAETGLVIVCDSSAREFAEQLRFVVEKARGVLRDTFDLRRLLDQAPGGLAKGQTLSWVREQLEHDRPRAL